MECPSQEIHEIKCTTKRKDLTVTSEHRKITFEKKELQHNVTNECIK